MSRALFELSSIFLQTVQNVKLVPRLTEFSMSLINYVVDAYEVFAASAMGAMSASRSLFGVVLPFAASPM